MKRAWLLAALLLLCLPFSHAGEPAARKPLVMGVFPYLSANVVIKKLLPLRDYLEKQLGQPVQLYTAPDFRSFAQRTRQGEFDIVLTAPHFARLAQEESGYVPLATYQAELRGLIVVAKQSPITRVEDLRGKRVAVPDMTAIVPMMGLRIISSAGLRPGKDFQVITARSHNNAAISVQHGYSEAAIIGSAPFSQLPAELHGGLRVLASTERIPNQYYLAHPRLGQAQTERLRGLLPRFAETPEGREFIEENHVEGIKASNGAELKRLDGFAKEARRLLEQAQ